MPESMPDILRRIASDLRRLCEHPEERRFPDALAQECPFPSSLDEFAAEVDAYAGRVARYLFHAEGRAADASFEAAKAAVDMEAAARIAEGFAKVLRRDLSAAEFQTARIRNRELRKAGEKHGCAMHDFCDANMAMEEAMQDELGRELISEAEDAHMSEADCALWNAAYAIASERYLTAADGEE